MSLIEEVEVTYKLEFTVSSPRKKAYRGMTDEEIREMYEDQGQVCQDIVEMLSFIDSLDDVTRLKAKVRFVMKENEEEE